MNTLDLDKRCQALSAGDGEIASALAALDERIRTWLDALQRRELYQPPAPAPAAPKPGPAGKTNKTKLMAAPAATAPPAPAPEPEPAPNPADQDDEALLASLDPELANAVRVRSRLSGRKTSIRELVRDVEASMETKRKKSKRSAWFRS